MTTEQLYDIFRRHSHVVIDSRQIVAGCLFFAMRGERFDGNDFALTALEAGAAFAVIDRPELAGNNERLLLVEDTLLALQHLARHHRRQFEIPVLGITGSNGKTTTKELISAVLGSHYSLHYTPGNYNNHIGVPLTLLAMPAGTEVAVIEMGANHQGEIDALSRIAEPTHGLITNVGKAHLEGFGGVEGVRKGKSELYRFLAGRDGVAFVNRDSEHLEELAAPVRKKILYGRIDSLNDESGPYEVELLATQPFVTAAFLDDAGARIEVESNLPGLYNFHNIMTAIVVGKYFKVPCAKIRTAIESYLPNNNRSQLLPRGSNTFVLDAYNANPSSMREAIETFGQLAAIRKVAVLGEMLELGDYAAAEHEAIARFAFKQSFDTLVLVGEAFLPVARKLGIPHFPDVKALKEWLDSQHFENTHILLKGSRRIRLEEVVKGEEMTGQEKRL